MGNKYAWILGIFTVSLLLSGGLAFWTFFADDQVPEFQAVSVNPTEFRFTGGSLQVRSEVSDDEAVEGVKGVLWQGESQIAQVAMTRSDDGARGPIYSAEFTVPANVASTGQPVDYTLQLLVYDSTGQESKREMSFEVPAPGVPPSPPQLRSAD
jgi:hypothetical protein